ncbi:MAG: hypothetical protein FWF81_10290 [Defluviitaleaceae bacterium]|nr:hypothetical protein [Defluviitaleaceae bacterium]
MVNQQKIIAMTKLALYDKHEGATDRAANDYFRHDYIYRKNMGTRLSVGLGGVIILVLYWLRIIIVDGIDIFEMDIRYYAQDTVFFIVALVAIYSLIGTIQGTREYYLVQKRLQRYQGMLRFLENTEGKRAEAEEAPKPAEEAQPLTRLEELRAKREQREQREQRNLDNEPEWKRREREWEERKILREKRKHEREQRERESAPLVSLRDVEAATRRTNQTTQKNSDPLANVTSRAISGSRPRPPLVRKPDSNK